VLIKPIPIRKEINGQSRSDDFLKITTAKKNEKTVPISKILFTHISKILSNHSKKISPFILIMRIQIKNCEKNKEKESDDKDVISGDSFI